MMSESGQASPTERPEDFPALRLDGVSDVEAESLLLDTVRRHMAVIIGDAPQRFADPERPFRELGLDSLGGVELHRRLTASTGIALPVTVVFEHPSPATLTRHLVALVRGREPAADVVVPRAVIGTEPLAVVGLGWRDSGG